MSERVRRLCDVLGIDRPVLCAPMAKIAGGRLSSAVSKAGGLGVLGGGYGDPAWIEQEMAETESARVGIGLITWNMPADAVETALAFNPAALWLSFGDVARYVQPVHDSAAALICQVGSVREAVQAAEAGAEVIVAQGNESGGHDVARGPDWPEQYSGRSLRTGLTDRWSGREHEMRTQAADIRKQHDRAAAEGDMAVRVVWAGEGIDGITSIRPAGDIVRDFPSIGSL